MAQPKATFEAVAAAIEQLKAEGRSASIAAIQAITGGSNTTITVHKRQYEAQRPTIQAAKTININPRIGELIAEEIGRAANEAADTASRKLEEIEVDMNNVAAEAEATAAELEARERELDAARAQAQALAGQIEQLKDDAEQVKADAAAKVLQEQERARAAIDKAESETARERGERESTQKDLAKAELRLESLPRLEAEIERLRRELDQERAGRTAAEQAAAVAAARLVDAQAALAGSEAREVESKRRIEVLENQVAEARADAKKSGEAAAELRAQVQGAKEFEEWRKSRVPVPVTGSVERGQVADSDALLTKLNGLESDEK